MHLIQFEDSKSNRRVGRVDGEIIAAIRGASTTRALALDAIKNGVGLGEEVTRRGTDETFEYEALLAQEKVLPPVDHEDPAHCMISGTGLTHIGSAAARSDMHAKVQQQHDEGNMTDSMRLFKWGVEGGKPAAGKVGVQSEWFYKGDGSTVARPNSTFLVPDFATDHGEEPEVVGLYVIGPDRTPYRLGYAIGNECTDHVMEKKNYLYLAHSKLRTCSFGPELRLGDLPRNVEGMAKIIRGKEVIWKKAFASGEDNMCHTLANIEYHHFKYDQFIRPGDVHIHFFGTSVASFGDGVFAVEGDRFEIGIPLFGKPLINSIGRSKERTADRIVRQL